MGKKPKQSIAKPSASSTNATPTTTASKQEEVSETENQSKSFWSFQTQRAMNLLALAALYGPLSQLILAPVYGSIPSSTYHKYLLTASPLLAFTLRDILPQWTARLVSPIAYWIPTLHFVLLQYSSQLDQNGPLVTELLTILPLLTLSLHTAMKLAEDIDLPLIGESEAGPPMVLYLVYLLFQRLMKDIIPTIIGWHAVFSRVGLQLVIATMYGLIIPQSFFWPAIPSIVFTMTANPHLPLQRNNAIANNTLSLYNYTLLERRDSLTGYLSVLQDNHQEFRVMRCDHSLLGGEWQFPAPAGVYRPVGETIYPVFTMLEAVRLIAPPAASAELPSISKSDAGKRALTIGLGTGSAPSAFIAHGINTTILELDPVVHYFAGKYFNLPKNHSYYIGDAVDFVHNQISKIDTITKSTSHPQSTKDSSCPKDLEALQYDYILHDTFTGGALPIPLFTQSFLRSLSGLIKPTGVIAINYAGDLDLPSAALVYRTITSVFDRCRIFREDVEQPKPKPKPKLKSKRSTDTNSRTETKSKTKGRHDGGNDKKESESEEEEKYLYDGDFTNLVYYCLPPTAPPNHIIQFRKPTEADFLGSGARRHYMMPKHELVDAEIKFGSNGQRGVEKKEKKNEPEVLEMSDGKSVRLVSEWQARSAFGHWKLMRTVIRPEVWEVW